MISSVTNTSTPFPNTLARSGQAVVRQESAVSKAEEATLRAIDQIADAAHRTGIEQTLRQEDRAAVDPQRSGTQQVDEELAGKAADLLVQKEALRANVAVLKTADRMVGTLLDVFA